LVGDLPTGVGVKAAGTNVAVLGVGAGAREVEFPRTDHSGRFLAAPVTAASINSQLIHRQDVRPGTVNPYLAYLASLSTPESRRSMAGCLDRIAALATGQPVNAAHRAGQQFPWGQLRFSHTTAIRAMLTAQTRDGTPWSPAYCNKHLAALRKVLEYAWLLDQMTAEDYHRAAKIEGVKGIRLPAGRSVGPAELNVLLEACADGTPAGVRDTALIATLYSTGCRREEIATADREQYDPGRRALRIIGKGNREREVYLQAQAAVYLGWWLALGNLRRGPLFSPVSRWGEIGRRHMTSDAVGKVVTRRGALAGLPPVTAHDLRRSFIGDLLDAGVDLATVQQLVGHASSSTTAGYDRRPARTRQAAVDRLVLPQLDAAAAVTDE
jgi:site-specific recombinase XerD